MKKNMRQKCVNGCDAPPDPPSWVICRECQDKITEKMEEILAKIEARQTRIDKQAEESAE